MFGYSLNYTKFFIGRKLIKFSLLSMILLTLSCGGSNDGDQQTISQLEEPAYNLSGKWQFYMVEDGNCSENYPKYISDTIIVNQTDNSIMITRESKDVDFKGTISNDQISAKYIENDDYGQSIAQVNCTVLNEDLFSCDAEWTWIAYDSSKTCNGTSEISATRMTSTLIDVSGTWNGDWHSNNYGLSGTFTANITQNNSVLTGSIVVNPNIVDSQLKGSVSGNEFVFGDIGNQITFNGDLISSGQASGSYIYPNLGDKGSWTGKNKSTSLDKNINKQNLTFALDANKDASANPTEQAPDKCVNTTYSAYDHGYSKNQNELNNENFVLYKTKLYDYKISDIDEDGVIDAWDKCPNTPKDNYTDKYGCSFGEDDLDIYGYIIIKDVQNLEGSASLIQSGQFHQKVQINNDGFFKFPTINKDKPFSVIIRRTMQEE